MAQFITEERKKNEKEALLNTAAKKGLLILDYDGTTVNEELKVFEKLKTLLPTLAAQGIEIVILTAKPWSETKTKSLDDAFGKDRTFLKVPSDIYDSNRTGEELKALTAEKGEAVEKIMQNRGYTTANTHFVDDDKVHVGSAEKRGIHASHVTPTSNFDPRPNPQFFAELEATLEAQFFPSAKCCQII